MADKNDGSWMKQLAAEMLAFGRYIKASLADPAQRDAIGRTLGIALSPLGATPGPSPTSAVTPGESTIAKYIDGEDIDILALLDAFAEQGASWRALLETFDEAQVLALDVLATDYLYRKHPKWYFRMQFIGWLSETTSQLGEGYTTVDRALSAVWDLLGFLILGSGDPLNKLANESDAQALSNPTLRLAALILIGLRVKMVKGPQKDNKFLDWARQEALDMLYGWDVVPPLQTVPADPADLISRRMLSVRLHARDKDDDPTSTQDASLGVSMALVPKAHGGPGVFVAFSGGEDLEFHLSDRLRARVQLQATALPLWFTADDVRAAAPAGTLAAVTITSVDTPDRKSLFAFPDTETLKFEVGGVSMQGSIAEDGPGAEVALRSCVLTFDSSQIDGFIGSLLPDRKTKVKFNIGKRYVKGSGWHWTGEVKDFDSKKVEPAGTPPPPPPAAAPPGEPPLPLLPGGEPSPGGFQKRMHLGKSLGPVRLDDLQIGISGSASGEEPHANVTAAVSVSAHIGPVFARVDHVGLRATLTRRADSSKNNLGFADLDIGFLAPRAVGITVDAKAVKGGGFIFYDPDKHQYGGVLELEISGLVSLKAIGLVATRMPGGTKGYSMVLIITAENFRWQLPMGFAITGIGGLMAIHRTCSEEALREGLRAKALDLILFPKDPVANAPNIFAAIERVFPAQHRSYILGPMLRITWGVPSIITMDLGLLIEWGVRDRFIVLGRISAILPNTDNDLLRLRMDVLGIVDFDQGTVAIDAVLVDSKLLDKFVLTGAMALRMRWTSPRSFALAVGGMHRSFTPPAGFPTLERLALNLTTGSNPRLTCEAYFALTANSVQFGAAAHLYAEGPMGFNVTGDAGFDVLITLAPFHFLAEFMASMQIRKGTRNIVKVKVEGALEGPRPLTVRAKATFEILWWDVSIRVNATLIGGERPPLPPGVNALEQLLVALRDTRNWHGELPAGQSRIVVLREAVAGSAATAPIAVHPLATLTVRQTVVPLNTAPIDRFGDAPVSGERQFRIASVTINGTNELPTSLQPLREDFAPAQFFEMDDERKLTSPSFVPMDAGVQIGSALPTFRLDQSKAAPLEYETKIIDRSLAPSSPQRITTLPLRYALAGAQLEQQARHGAAGRSVLRREDPLRDDLPPAVHVKIVQPAFALIDAVLVNATVQPRERAPAAAPQDFTAANAKAKRSRRQQVVPAFEVAESLK